MISDWDVTVTGGIAAGRVRRDARLAGPVAMAELKPRVFEHALVRASRGSSCLKAAGPAGGA